MSAFERLTGPRREKVRNVVDAIEAFTDAKTAHERPRAYRPSTRADIDEAREHLLDKLAELIDAPMRSSAP